jgi:hypothetical protein
LIVLWVFLGIFGWGGFFFCICRKPHAPLPAGSEAIAPANDGWGPGSVLPSGSEAIAPADDGWGPYKPILAIFDNGRELIPGKLCTSKNKAFYSKGGREHECHNYKVVRGTIMARG